MAQEPTYNLISGKYKFNSTLPQLAEGEYPVNFSSNGTAFDKFAVEGVNFYYLNSVNAGVNAYLFGVNFWNSGEGCRDIDFGATPQEVSSTLFDYITANAVKEETTTTYDLANLSLAAGTYSITAKAEADGYMISEASNAVSYTVQSSTGYYITFANVAYDNAISEHVFIQINGEGDWIDLDNTGSLEEYNNVKLLKIYYVPNGTVSMALLNNDGGYPDMEDPSLSQFDITSATSADTAMTIPVTGDNTDFVVTVFATSAFKQISLIKLDSINYSAIALANVNKVYTIKDTTLSSGSTNYIVAIKKNTSGNGWLGFCRGLELNINSVAGNETTIVFLAAMYTNTYSGPFYHNYIVLEGDTEATAEDFTNFTASSDANLIYYTWVTCFAENTLISTRNGDKFVQDITYDDDILVWNFDEGKLNYAKPIFIKQEQTSDSYWHVTDEDGKTVNLVGSDGKSHRLYNKRTHLFEYPQDIPECKCEEIHESVKYYNILTEYHFNCFANGILTSKRYSNMLYPITDEMKYDKTVKHTNTCKREQFDFLTDDEFEKLRLSEMEYSDEMCDEVRRFFALKRELRR